jgi:cell wall-associated NlpC family hydrolase
MHLQQKIALALLLLVPAAATVASPAVVTSADLAQPASLLMADLPVYAPGPALAQAAMPDTTSLAAAAIVTPVNPLVAGVARLAAVAADDSDADDNDSDMPDTGVDADTSALAGTDPRHVLLQLAMKLRDIRYRRGGDTPSTGFDCSGFVRYVFSHSIGLDLPANSASQFLAGLKVNRGDMKPGDLVFFRTHGKRITHVGIYIANGQFIHSPSTGKTVRVDSLDEAYWSRRFAGAKRPDGIARI